MEREHREDLVAVDRVAVAVDSEHPVAVAVERDPEIESALADGLLQQREVGGAAAIVDVLAVRRVADRGHLGAEPLERLRRDPGVGAVGAVDAEPQAGEVVAEALEHMVEVALGVDVDPVDRAAAAFGRVEQPLDLLLGGVAQLAAVLVEELDPVVLGRVVRGGDDDAEVEREQRHRGRRQDAGEHRIAAGRDDAARERLFELRPRAARVAADEDAAAPRPERRCFAQLLDELGGQILADDATDAVSPEVPAQAGGYRLENCGALRALCSPAFLRSTTRASRVRKPSRLSGTRSSGSASTSARAIPWRTAPAWPEGPPP